VFILHLQQNILAQQLEGEGFLPVISLQPLAHKVFFYRSKPVYSEILGVRIL
jgi:hypothetical protein